MKWQSLDLEAKWLMQNTFESPSTNEGDMELT